jgi:hypothetical protein
MYSTASIDAAALPIGHRTPECGRKNAVATDKSSILMALACFQSRRRRRIAIIISLEQLL